jgi:hypothetical protein
MKVEKDKFDSLLKRMIAADPLRRDDIKPIRRKKTQQFKKARPSSQSTKRKA